MKFKIGDKVKIYPWDIKGSIYSIDEEDNISPYLVEDEDGQTSWWPEGELEADNEQIS
ncbi:hypothetical protein [Morganella morganii]|uniref:hypothetical protein n=1 Tax=Morganella morganii TaxID=582 RepID=UPI0028099F6F|nr:hypothetical protein SUGSMm_22050 [Morganella morganii subsp. sibonii]HDU8309510.1 hypothetical protein [Morganella morganii subsp. sibonii]